HEIVTEVAHVGERRRRGHLACPLDEGPGVAGAGDAVALSVRGTQLASRERGDRLTRRQPGRQQYDATDQPVVRDPAGGAPTHRVADDRDRQPTVLLADPVERPAGVLDLAGAVVVPADGAIAQDRQPDTLAVQWPPQVAREAERPSPGQAARCHLIARVGLA